MSALGLLPSALCPLLSALTGDPFPALTGDPPSAKLLEFGHELWRRLLRNAVGSCQPTLTIDEGGAERMTDLIWIRGLASDEGHTEIGGESVDFLLTRR